MGCARTPFALRVILLACALVAGAPLHGLAGEPEKRASDELKWGYKAARRGYWQEALMRFERADRLTPGRPRVLNNLAVALEALGRYDEAGEVYGRALALAPNDAALRRNRERFDEFVEGYLTEDSADEAAEDPATPADQAPAEASGANDAQG